MMLDAGEETELGGTLGKRGVSRSQLDWVEGHSGAGGRAAGGWGVLSFRLFKVTPKKRSLYFLCLNLFYV